MRHMLLGVAVLATACAPTLVSAPEAPTPTVSTASATVSVGGLPVYPKGRGPSRRCEILLILDFHSDAESEEKGFEALRARAAAAGADAVIDAEYEHGEAGEQSHLSGMAVRWIAEDARAHDVLGDIVVETAAGSPDKGFEQLRARARALGADKLVDVHFEHGEDGAPSRLRGTAVRYRR